MAKKTEGAVTADLGITYTEVYEALQKSGRPTTIASVKELCDYLRTTARDAARDALLDWPNYLKVTSEQASVQ